MGVPPDDEAEAPVAAETIAEPADLAPPTYAMPGDAGTPIGFDTSADEAEPSEGVAARGSAVAARLARLGRRSLIVVGAVALVAALALAGTRLIGSGANSTPDPAASPSVAMAPATATATATASTTLAAPQSAAPRTTPTSSITPSPSPSPAPPSLPTQAAPLPSQTTPTASITFRNLVLDSATDANRTIRTFSFTSDGPGGVSAEVVASSPIDSTKLCLAMESDSPVCSTGGTPGLQAVATSQSQTRWTVTLTSADSTSPTVDVVFIWPARSPSISLTHGQFQGTPNPDSLRTLTATFRTRTSGRATLDSSWVPSQLNASVALTDISAASQVSAGGMKYVAKSSTVPIFSASVGAGRTYRMVLSNDSSDGTRPDLTATITFP